MFTSASVIDLADKLVIDLQAAVGQLANRPGVHLGQLNLGLDGMRQAVARMQAVAHDPVQCAAAMARFVTDANAVLQVLALLPLPPAVAIAVRIAGLLLPAITGAAAVLWPARPAVPGVAPA